MRSHENYYKKKELTVVKEVVRLLDDAGNRLKYLNNERNLVLCHCRWSTSAKVFITIIIITDTLLLSGEAPQIYSDRCKWRLFCYGHPLRELQKMIARKH